MPAPYGFGVGDFLAVASLAWTLYHDCILLARGAPQEFKMLVEELKTLHMMMKSFDEEFKDPDSVLVKAGEDRHNMIKNILERINETLEDLTSAFQKHRKLGSTTRDGRIKRSWDKFKWALDAKDVDGLRSKLSYHNGVLGLLLTCAGNSSLRRIEDTTQSIEAGLVQLKTFLRRAETGNLHVRAPVITTSVLEVSARIEFSERCMKAAEISQRWIAIGIDEWIKAGRWWLLRARADLETPFVAVEGVLSLDGYVNLLKASWILTDVITVHPQLGYIEPSIQYEVLRLTEAINQEFKRMQELNVKIPALAVSTDIVIWEGQHPNSTPRPSPGGRKEERWALLDERIEYQGFGKYQPHSHTTSITAVVLLLVKNTNQARLVFHDQGWRCLLEVQLAPGVLTELMLRDTAVRIAQHQVIVATREDAILLYSTILVYTQYMGNLPFAAAITPLHCTAVTLLHALKETWSDTGLLTNILRLDQFRSAGSNSTMPQARDGHSFLESVRMVAVTRKSIDQSDSNFIIGSNRKRFERFAGSLLGWVLFKGYYEVATEWVKDVGVNSPSDNAALEAWFLPRRCIEEGIFELVSLWVSSGLALGGQNSGIWVSCEECVEPTQPRVSPPSINCRDCSDIRATAVHYAAGGGQEAIVRILVKLEDVEADAKDNHGRTPLSWAAENGHEAIAKLLAEREDVCADSKAGNDRTPLSWAAENGHEAIAKLLVEREDVFADSKAGNGRTPLSWAGGNGHEAIAKLLVEREDVDTDSKDIIGQTPLSWAAGKGHEAIVKLLVERDDVGADAKDINDRTPLSWAAEKGHETIVKLLVERGDVDVNSKDKSNQTPLFWAIRSGHEAIVKLLVEWGDVDINSKDNGGQAPLSRAAENGHEAIVKLLLKQEDVDVNSKDNNRRTALSLVSKEGHEAIVKLFIEREDVEADSKDTLGRTALAWAACMGHEAIVKLLVEQKDVNVNTKDNYGQSPLSLAAEKGHEAIVKLLIERKDVLADSKDQYGHTPLWMASRYLALLILTPEFML